MNNSQPPPGVGPALSALKALEFAAGAIMDAIGCEDGLDGRAGAAVLAMINAALVANGRPKMPAPHDDDDTAWYRQFLTDRLSALSGSVGGQTEQKGSVVMDICGDLHGGGEKWRFVCNRERGHAGDHAATVGPTWPRKPPQLIQHEAQVERAVAEAFQPAPVAWIVSASDSIPYPHIERLVDVGRFPSGTKLYADQAQLGSVGGLNAAPPEPLERQDDLGLSIDMLDVDRLRDWARLLLVHGADISHWGSVPFVASKMQIMATEMEKAIRDIGTLRALPASPVCAAETQE